MDIKKTKEEMVSWIRNWVNNSGNEETKIVLGVSGGKDSTCLLYGGVEAVGPERIVAVLMPNGEQKDISDSIRVCELTGVKYIVIDISKGYNPLTDEITSKLGIDPTPGSKTNTPARIRMTTLYDIAARIGNCRVINTCNLSEDLVGYSTLYGDSAGDFSPLAHLFVDEVMEVCDELGVPKELGHKTPSDGMCGKSDEDNLGFTYDDLKKVATRNTEGMDKEVVEVIQNKIKNMAWKKALQNMPSYIPEERNSEVW